MFYIKNPYILEDAQLWLTMEMCLEKKSEATVWQWRYEDLQSDE